MLAELDAPSDPDLPTVPLLPEAPRPEKAVIRLNNDTTVLFKGCLPGLAEGERRTSRNQFVKLLRVAAVLRWAKVIGDSLGWG